MSVNVRFCMALWIGLALAGCASHAPVTDVSVAPLTLDTEPQARPDFSGHWVFNAKASDDPQEKVKEAMKAMQQAKGGGSGMGGGSGGQGSGMGKGRESSGGMGGRNKMPAGEMPELTATPARLDISHEDPILLIADENDRQQRLFTDFRGASVSISSSVQQRVAVAGWEGAVLVVETTMTGGTRLIQRYQIDSETGRLMMSATANLAEKQPVSYRLVYDLLKPGTDVGSR